MSFGYSIGDFFAGANLSYQLIKALSGTKSAFIEYQEALVELGCLQQTFLQVGRMTTNPNFSPATVNAASHIVLSSMGLIGDFLERTKRYRKKFNGRVPGNAMSDSWQKMGWILFTKEELKSLTNALHVKLSNISLLLSTAKFKEQIPTQVAQYQITPPVSSSPPPSYTHLAEEDQSETMESPLQASDNIQAVQSYAGTAPNNKANLEFEARFARLEAILAREHIQDKATGNQDGLELDMEGSVLEPKVQEMILGARQISNDKPDEPQNVEEYEGDEKENEGKEVGLFTQFEMLLKAQRKKEVLDSVLVNDLETLLEKHAQTKPFEYHAQAILAEIKSKPIKFKDAVNRKFSFPFHLCATWAGMEELIKQAFLHVDVIGPHVEAGHYDLVGPNREIILPQVWETTIEPDWSITMLMWPMPKPEKQEPEGKVGSKKEDKEKFLGWIAGKATKMLKKEEPRTERSYP